MHVNALLGTFFNQPEVIDTKQKTRQATVIAIKIMSNLWVCFYSSPFTAPSRDHLMSLKWNKQATEAVRFAMTNFQSYVEHLAKHDMDIIWADCACKAVHCWITRVSVLWHSHPVSSSQSLAGAFRLLTFEKGVYATSLSRALNLLVRKREKLVQTFGCWNLWAVSFSRWLKPSHRPEPY